MQSIDLPFKGFGHHPFAQSFDAVHFRLHQAWSVLIAPHFPYPSTQTPACGDSRIAVHKGIAFANPGILSRRDDGNGTSLNGCFVGSLSVMRSIASKTPDALVVRNLDQKIRYNGRIDYLVAGHANCTHLQCLCINADVQVAPLTTARRAVRFCISIRLRPKT